MTGRTTKQKNSLHPAKKTALLVVAAAVLITGPGRAQEPDYTKHPRYPEFATLYQAYDRASASRDFRAALEPARRALPLAVEIFGENSLMAAAMHDRLAYAESATGNFDRAIELYEKAIKLYSEQFGGGHEYVGTAYLNMGEAYRSKGDITRALEFHTTAMKIFSNRLGEKHVYVATACNYIGGALKTKGDYRSAITYYEKALAIYREALGDEHEFTATTYVNLGGAHEPLGEYRKAVDYYLKAVAIYKKTIGEDHPFLAVTYNNLGLGYYYLGDGDNSIKYYDLALDIYLRTVGPEHPHTAYAYINLGQIHRSLANYDTSEKHYFTALEILTKSADREGRITALSHIGELCNERKNYAKAAESFNAAVALVLKYRLEIGRGKAGFTDQHIDVFNRLIDIELLRGNNEKAFIADCMKKGLSITEDMTLKGSLAKGKVPPKEQERLLAVINDIEKADSDRAVLAQSGRNEEAEKILKLIWKLESEKEKIDRELMNTYPAYASLRSTAAPKIQELMDALGPDRAMISYSMREKYCTAFVLTGQKGLEVVRLGGGDEAAYASIMNEARNMHTLYKNPARGTVLTRIKDTGGAPVYWNREWEKEKYRVRGKDVYSSEQNPSGALDLLQAGHGLKKENRIGSLDGVLRENEIEAERQRLSRNLYNALLRPVIEKTPSAKKFVIIPDGPVYYVPLGLLRDDSGAMFSGQYSLVHSPTIWLGLRKKGAATAKNPLLAMGNAVYAAGHRDRGSAARGKKRSVSVSVIDALKDGTQLPSENTGQKDPGYGNLPGTGEEIARIAAIAYRKKPGAENHMFTGINANEDRLFTMNREKLLEHYRVIHLAAHGLFMDSNPSLNAIVLSLPAALKKDKKEEYSAYVSRFGEIKRDGFLRLGEIKTLSLDCDLVVMSACETSLGHYVRGEGMIGLPQAFVIAGSRSVMASLWPVDDEAACLLMEEFYRNMLVRGLAPDRALQQAQLWLSEEFTDPYFWAPFIIYGE